MRYVVTPKVSIKIVYVFGAIQRGYVYSIVLDWGYLSSDTAAYIVDFESNFTKTATFNEPITRHVLRLFILF